MKQKHDLPIKERSNYVNNLNFSISSFPPDEGGSIFENMSNRTGAHGTVVESTMGTTHDGSRSINESAAWDYDYADGGLNYADSIADTVTKFVLRFVERVCLEANINTDHVKTLQSLVPGEGLLFWKIFSIKKGPWIRLLN